MKKSFFSTREGEMSLAALLCLLALPVIALGAAKSGAACYAELGMIISGMAFPPLRAYVFKRK